MESEENLLAMGAGYSDFFDIMSDQFRDGYTTISGETLEILDFMMTNMDVTKEEMIAILNELGGDMTDGWAHYMYLLEDSTANGFDGIIGEVDRGTRGTIDIIEKGGFEATSIWNWHMAGLVDTTEEGFTGMIGEADRGMRGFNQTVYQGMQYTQEMMDESYRNMLKYWEDAQSIFGGDPIGGQLPGWENNDLPPPLPFVPPLPDNPLLPYNPADQPVDYGDLDRSATVPGAPPTSSPSRDYTVNNLYITTNAEVTSDIPDLLLLRAWSSG